MGAVGEAVTQDEQTATEKEKYSAELKETEHKLFNAILNLWILKPDWSEGDSFCLTVGLYTSICSVIVSIATEHSQTCTAHRNVWNLNVSG